MNRRVPIPLRLALALSGTACTVLLMQTPSKWSFLITALLSLGLLLWGMIRWNLLDRMLAEEDWRLRLAAAVLALSAVYTAKSTFFVNCWTWVYRLVGGLPHWELIMRIIPWIVALLALPMMFCYFLWFLGIMKGVAERLWRDSDFTERLFFLGAGIIFAMMIVFAYVCTQAFYGAHTNGYYYNFDLIYSADSGYLVHQDVYRNIGAEQNDLRQPLFGVFAAPFAQTAFLISKILFFLPNGYVTICQMVQLLLYLVAMILLSRMMGLRGAEKALFLAMLSVTYPVLIFSLTAEQYLLAVFYLILMLYLREDRTGQSMSYVAATGSLLTSGIWFPLVTWNRDLKKFVKNTLVLCGVFFAVTILSGRLTTFLDMPDYIGKYGYYSGADMAPLDKLMQYVNFAGACLLAPRSGPDLTTYSHISWQMLPVDRWSPAGLAVIGAALGGILISPRERFTRLCAVWIGFSFLLLGIVGWGTIDNGLMLYSLYFGWAFAAMAFRLADRALAKARPLKLVLMLALILAMCVVNVYALRNVLIFGSQYYPMLGGIP